jgi:hypothetical protein
LVSENQLDSNILGIKLASLCVDTFPIYINRPEKHQELFYNGKYKSHVLKVQVFCDNRASIVGFSGPHVGCTHDLSIFYDNRPMINTNETILGDKAYCGRVAKQLGIIAPFKKPPNRQLSEEQIVFNGIHAFNRSSVEHSIGYLKRFQILYARHRGIRIRPNKMP